ncbi:MAG: flagellar hook-basal body complex protein FliE [Lachnospiraceae bacterium]|nr:flagellar hook-basal body complex protein FliE [Lachnospiraceae bacterium]
MNISEIKFLESDFIKSELKSSLGGESDKNFDSVFKAALNMLDETNALTNKAEELEVQFLLGDAVNTHDLQVAQQKANTALQYTVAVRDKVIEAYNSIINMQV